MRSQYTLSFSSPIAQQRLQFSNHVSLLQIQGSYPAPTLVSSSAQRAAITAKRAPKAPPTEIATLTADPVNGTIEVAVTPPEEAGVAVAVTAPEVVTG